MPSGAEWFIVLAVVLVIFGGSQRSQLAKNLGEAQKESKDCLAEGEGDDVAGGTPPARSDAPAPSPVAPKRDCPPAARPPPTSDRGRPRLTTRAGRATPRRWT